MEGMVHCVKEMGFLKRNFIKGFFKIILLKINFIYLFIFDCAGSLLHGIFFSFFSCQQDLLSIAVRGLLTVVAFLVVELKFKGSGFGMLSQ